jgi:hypothetical protein
LDEKRQCRASSDHHNPLDNRLKDGAALHGILFLSARTKEFQGYLRAKFFSTGQYNVASSDDVHYASWPDPIL